MVRDPALRTVQVVTLGWLIAIGVSLLGGAYWLRDQPWAAARTAVDWKWLRRGVTVSLPFLGATLALRGVLSIDRYALQAVWGAEAVGVYTFYVSIRNAIQSLLDMGVVAVMRPRIIGAYQGGRMEEYRGLMRNLALAIGGMAAVLCLVAALGISSLLAFVGNPLYGEHLSAFWILLAVTFVAALGDVPHVALYAMEKDHAIVVSTVLGLVGAVVLNILLVPSYGLAGAALATLIACAIIALAKTGFLRVGRRP
jgi:O-antigen/teichoic acid export membrane protein